MKNRFLISALMVVLMAQTASAATFEDVSAQTDYSDSIYWTVDQGITQGYGDGNWGPDNCVTRAELLKMILEYKYGIDEIKDTLKNIDALPIDYKDVDATDWFFYYVTFASLEQIVEGYSDVTFRPDNCVNRVEAMKMAVNTLLPGQEIESADPLQYWGSHGPTMVDMDKFAWYAPYARFLFNYALVGTRHTVQAEVEGQYDQDYLKFFPAGDMSRKEVAYMLNRIDSYLK